MEYIVIPLFFGFVTALVGRAKGSSFFIWFIAGFVLPFVGLAAAILSRDERLDPRRECPRCAKVLPISAQVCSRCGEDMDYPDELLV
ncbi:MAG: hypothetical protein WAO61_09640 [Solirubrobacterales bacterium]